MCGFISILGPTGSTVVSEVLQGLLAIQHRGQDATGIVTFTDKFHVKKGTGLVQEVFTEKHLTQLKGHMAVGHVRYPTVGDNSEKNVQPFWIDFPLGITMAYNGNITNYFNLKEQYFPERKCYMTSDCDLEALLYVFASVLIKNFPKKIKPESIFDAVNEVFKTVKGSYSVAGLIPYYGMFAFRDPYGIKPIILGERISRNNEKYYAIASESVVLDMNNYKTQKDLKPGEVIFIDNNRKIHSKKLTNKPHRPCIFELVYFARPDSILDKVSVYNARLCMGKSLAKKWRTTGLEVDVIISVPESARIAALAMAQALDIPYREGLVKNRYIGRTFIMANNLERQDSIRIKLNTISSEFKDKKVLLVDDSIVRGNTSRELIRMAREAGAQKVYLASCSSPLRYPCPYGIDMSTKKEFIARNKTPEEVAKVINADAVIYQNLYDLEKSVKSESLKIKTYCKACFDGDYPTEDLTVENLEIIEKKEIPVEKSKIKGTTGISKMIGTIKVRISDNVLDSKEWSVIQLTLDTNYERVLEVIGQKTLYQGVYSFSFLGMKFKDLLNWIQSDSTGQHPEFYNEVWDPSVNRFINFISDDILYRIINTKEE